ncbi:C2 domain containing protein [Schistosoma japonicum]|uniref:C2 domain containing protein n=1 Tax=Schistosoma japonicum TaxID=6182 RepID=A0A4Z2CL34_SCHJA|nr:C2 domain containing protein [Schistosoma japonicum]
MNDNNVIQRFKGFITTTKLTPSQDNQFITGLLKFFHIHNTSLAIILFICLILSGILSLTLIWYLILVCWCKLLPNNKHSTLIFPNVDQHFKPFQLNQVYTKKGLLQYTLNYCTKLQTLTIGIINANDLNFPTNLTNYNTCVTITLSYWDYTHWILLDNQPMRTLYANGLKPQWNEKFTINLLKSQLLQTNLIIEVYICDSIGQDLCIGRIDVLLKEINSSLYMNKEYALTDLLKVYTVNFSDLGELCIGLQYEQLYCLRIRLIELLNLKNTINLNDVQIYCQLHHINQYGVKQILGEICIGSRSSQNTGVKHWLEMSNEPLNMTIMWHIWNPIT